MPLKLYNICTGLHEYLNNPLVVPGRGSPKGTAIRANLGIDVGAIFKQDSNDRFMSFCRSSAESIAVFPALGVDVGALAE